ncbi:hypothetical protein HFP57_05740 [Parasphingopyxis algicola]|uniref:hypothetical protein n=1 Tax=Parasphingopyxis algicola TaxID=2026624 RepID=UPI0015A015EC|nr:hypothetical protein [Parasphingopyxis algicola]QLC24577.1 hypothetical protein HFP57_05740 [Parasphingopyxis algicola]
MRTFGAIIMLLALSACSRHVDWTYLDWNGLAVDVCEDVDSCEVEDARDYQGAPHEQAMREPR